MKNLVSLTVFLVFLIFLPSLIQAQNQQDSTKTRIETVDGNEYIGIILEQTNEKIRLKTDNLGEISIAATQIKKITPVNQLIAKDGTFWLDNPQATRYFWAPNGYNLKQGEGYYQNVWILFNQAVYGLTDHFSAGVGVVPLFLFAGTSTPAWITAKFSMPVVENKFNLGVGALAGTIIGEQNTGFGILYGISTFGTKDKNLNVGLGWAFAGGEMAKKPTLNISAMIRTGPKGYFITENYFIGTSDEFVVMMMLGGRRIIKGTGLDFGVVMPFASEMDQFIAIPWLGLTIPF
jgi:hypothetical protein